jgi:hypothetical protein
MEVTFIDVERCLTSGHRIPLHFNFLFNGVPCVWEASLGTFSVQKIRNPELSLKCREYLASIGACFQSMLELENWASDHSWPNSDSLPDLEQVLGRDEN